MAAPRNHVAPPAFTPLPFGLLTALGPYVRNPGDSRWQVGVQWESICPVGSTTYDECLTVTGADAPPPPPPDKTTTDELQRRGATPFTVLTVVDCSAVGFWDRAPALVEEALARVESFQVERAIWTGLAADRAVVFPHLADDADVIENNVTLQTAAVTVTGTYDVVEGLGRLERELAECYHGVGVIHVPRVLAPALAEANLLVSDGVRYRTPNGNIVVLGEGYTGSAPDGSTSNSHVTVYATGLPFIYRGSIDITPPISTLNRDNNDVTVIAERTYLVGWDCCHIAINMTIGGIVSGVAGIP